MKHVISFLSGLLFSLGLGYSGMTQTHVVKGFLDVFGHWNMNLLGVMMAAIGIHSTVFIFVKKRKSPLLDVQFYLPMKKAIDKKLLLGAALFGMGWGWSGICPGPAIVSLAGGHLNTILFVGSLVLGMVFFKTMEKFFSKNKMSEHEKAAL
jgi:uncharacterized membrane protein YedE/YeeE